MLFRSATSAVILAAAATVSATPAPAPYKLAVMSLPGQSLLRRSTLGYQPDTADCNKGSTCAEACGAGYAECPSDNSAIHCYNPEASQSCCYDGSGNSCDAGFYCTHDTQMTTWCCPEDMDLAECAAAYSVSGALESVASTTSISSTSTTTTSTTSTSTTPTTTSTPSTTSTPMTTSCTTTPITTVVTTSCASNTSTTSWSTANSTMTSASYTSTPVFIPTSSNDEPTETTSTPAEPTGAASASGVSLALLVAAAGVVALF